jgi:hypothetical protein
VYETDYGVVFALPLVGVEISGCPAGSPDCTCSEVSVLGWPVVAGATAAGTPVLGVETDADLAIPVPRRNPSIAPRRTPATASRLATAQVVDPSANDAGAADCAGAAGLAAGFAEGADTAGFDDLPGVLSGSGSSSKKKSCSLTWIPYLSSRHIRSPAAHVDPPREHAERRTDRAVS